MATRLAASGLRLLVGTGTPRHLRIPVCEDGHCSPVWRAEQRIAVITAPPQRQFLTDEPDDRLQAARVRLQLPDKFLFYPAQFWPHKNHLRLIEAFREVAAEVPDLNLVLTGKKRDEYEAVMSAVEQIRLERTRFSISDMSSRTIFRRFINSRRPWSCRRCSKASAFRSMKHFRSGPRLRPPTFLPSPSRLAMPVCCSIRNRSASIKQAILSIIKDPAAARQLGKKGTRPDVGDDAGALWRAIAGFADRDAIARSPQ